MELFIFLLILIAFALIATHWGYDSRDTYASSEWERRKAAFNLKTERHHL